LNGPDSFVALKVGWSFDSEGALTASTGHPSVVSQ